MNRVALYARVSTKDQHAENQILDLRGYASARKWEIVGEFIDQGVSGAKTNREGLDKLMELVRHRQVDVVLVWKFDRFARSMSHLLNALEEFKSLGVGFVSFTEAIDTTSSLGKFVFGVFSSLAEFERDLIRERVKAGMSKAKLRGKKFGRPGLNLDVAQVKALRSQGLSCRAIAEKLNCSKSLVAKLCSGK